MTVFSNFHTHTSYCDGKCSPEEMAQAAIALGCPSLGFSGHSYTDFDTSYCMSQEDTKLYISEITALKERYSGKLEILLGIEQDLLSDSSTAPYDFVIGSAHYVKKSGEYIPVDESEAILRDGVNRLWNGDFYAMARDYFALMATVAARNDIDFIGHFDLLTKFNANGAMFNEDDARYKNAALEVLKALCEKDTVFEVNTGAMFRGLRSIPCPAPFMLRAINGFGGRVILSSDSHDARSLCYAFPETAELLRLCGFKSVLTLEGGKLNPVKI